MSVGAASVFLFALLAVYLAWQYRVMFAALRSPAPSGDRTSEPAVCVILCLRGRDPFLNRCLDALAKQDYTNYRIAIVVDSARDEAMAQVVEAQHTYGADWIEVHVRDGFCKTCTRKLESLTWMLERVPSDVDIVAQCDGDAIVPSSWLCELVQGLDDPEVLAVSGNRWYAPPSSGLASLSRYYWNAMAVPLMNRFHVPWAGSLAMKRSLFADRDYIRHLRHSFTDDIATAQFLKKTGGRFRTLPRLLVLNQEDVSLSDYWGFLLRQMLAVRLQHPQWDSVFVHGIAVGCVLWVLRALCLCAGGIEMTLWTAGLLSFGLANGALIALYESQLRKFLQSKRGMNLPPFSVSQLLLLPVGLALTGWIYSAAIVMALFARTHEWRGVRYHIGSGGVRLLSERDYRMGPRCPECPSPGSPSSPVDFSQKTPCLGTQAS